MGNYDNDVANGFFAFIWIIAWVSFLIWSLGQYVFFRNYCCSSFWDNSFRCDCVCDHRNFKHNFNAF